MGLLANWIETYKNSSGKNIFVYVVNGPLTDIEYYKNIQGEHFRATPDGRAKFFTPFYFGKSGNLELTYNKSKYFIKNDKLGQAESLCEQFGGNLYLKLAEQSGDINWILHIENLKLSDPTKYDKHYKKDEPQYNVLKTKYNSLISTKISPEIKKQPKQYFEEGLTQEEGFTFLNEWHFAANAINKLKNVSEVSYKIIKQSSKATEDFAGIVSDELGRKYDIREDENIWMFNELLFIFDLIIINDNQNKTLTLNKDLSTSGCIKW